ncbi:MAG: hypothetical protein PHH85_05465 [Candidatus Methanoperedens sp.]|nr:hypothetical protein [Candidatus Methanoperedens sp.]
MNQKKLGNKLIIGIVCGLLLLILPAADAAQVVLVANSTGNVGQSGRLIGENLSALGVADAQWTTRTAISALNMNAMSVDDTTYFAQTGTTNVDAIININFTLANVGSVNYVYVTQIGSTTTNPEYNVLGLYNGTQANWTMVNVSNPPVGTYVAVTYNISSAEDKSRYLVLSGNTLTFRVSAPV